MTRGCGCTGRGGGYHSNIGEGTSRVTRQRWVSDAEIANVVTVADSSSNNMRGQYIIVVQVDQLSQRDRAAVCVSFGQKWKTGTGRQYLSDIIGLSSTTVT